MIVVIKNTKTKLFKELLVNSLTDNELNIILYFYNNRTNDYMAYIKE